MPEETEREKAVRTVLITLRNPLMLMSPDREEALRLTREHDLTVEDLIAYALKRARNT